MSAARPDHRSSGTSLPRSFRASSCPRPPCVARSRPPPPPPPLLSLDDLSHHSASPQPPTPPQAIMTPSPPPPHAGLFSPLCSNGSTAPAAWWSPSREEKARDGSPVDGLMHQRQSPTTASRQQSQQQQVALITTPPPREVARPKMPRDSVPAAGRVD